MKIEVNNGCFVEIEQKNYGICITSYDEKGTVKRRDGFNDGEIIMALNLLRNMRGCGKSAYILDDFALKILRDSGGIDYADEYRIFQ